MTKPSLAIPEFIRHDGTAGKSSGYGAVVPGVRRLRPTDEHQARWKGNIRIPPPPAGLSVLWEGFMSHIRQLGWVAALAAAVFAADPRAYGQEPQPPVNIDFEGVIAAARNVGPNRGPGNNFRDFN